MIAKPFCFVASPFAAKAPDEMDLNITYAEQICRRVALETPLIPFAPHLYFPRFLQDHEAAEREIGIAYAKQIMPLCSCAIFAVPPWRKEMSSGMIFELKLAQDKFDLDIFIGPGEIDSARMDIILRAIG